MNRPNLAAAALALLEASPLPPSVDELAATLGAPADEVRAALLELFDLAQAGAAPEPEGEPGRGDENS